MAVDVLVERRLTVKLFETSQAIDGAVCLVFQPDVRFQQTLRLESVTAQPAHKPGPGAVDQPVLVELDPVGEFLAACGALDDLHNPGFFFGAL